MSREYKTIGFIGAGSMAGAIAQSLVLSRTVEPDNVWINAKTDVHAGPLSQRLHAHRAASNRDLCDRCDVVVLGVKPDVVAEVLEECGARLENKLVISIAAGLSCAFLESLVPRTARVVRTMPNVCCQVGLSCTMITPGTRCDDEDVAYAKRMFAAVGTVVELPEKLIDVHTSMSASGIAYVFSFIDALAAGGVLNGLTPASARDVAVQTVLGAAKMMSETGLHPAVLRDAVTSAGGTTIHGLHALEEGGMRSAVMNAVTAGTKRAKELGQQQLQMLQAMQAAQQRDEQ